MVSGSDDFDPGFAGGGHDIGELFQGAQFQIDERRMRQKPAIEFAPTREAQIMGAALRRMPHGDNQRNPQFRQCRQEGGGIGGKIIHPNFKQIDFPRSNFLGTKQCPGGVHCRNYLRLFT